MVYFVMKVGNGQKFLSRSRTGKDRGFWVGYAEEQIPSFERPSPKRDLNLMIWAAANRERCRVLTYDETELHVWRINGPLKLLSDACNSGASDEKFWRVRSNLKNVIGDKEDLDHSFKNWKFLPATFERSVPRSELIAPVNSLSVYRYLNMGTFRPITNLAPEQQIRGDELHRSTEDIDVIHLKKGLASEERISETAFGRFVRNYLDWRIDDPKGRGPFSGWTESQRSDLIVDILNPAQVETAALLLCLDLEMMTDIGLGKGIDVIDVRATWRHLSESEQARIYQRFLKFCLETGARYTDKFAQQVQKERTVALQCKAFSSGEKLLETLLIDKDSAKARASAENGQIGNRMSIDSIFRAVRKPELRPNFPMLNQWLKLLSMDLGPLD